MDSLIARQVSRIYGSSPVVSGASLTLEPGKLTALLGGSGAGKSTLLRLFAGLEPVDAGEVLLGDEVLSAPGHMVPAEQRRIGLVFQDFALFPHMTALTNVCFGLNHLPKPERKAIAAEWLARLALTDRQDAFPHQLSGGEQQRVAIARALAPQPAAILMDEPFSGLDPALREDVREIALQAVREAGIPALLVTHDASEAMAYADHLAVMRAGEIVQQDAPETVYITPVDIETAAALGPINRIDASSSLASAVGAGSAVREEGVFIDPNGPVKAVVTSVRRVGSGMAVQFEIIGHGMLKATIAQTDAKPGDTVTIGFDPKLCFRF